MDLFKLKQFFSSLRGQLLLAVVLSLGLLAIMLTGLSIIQQRNALIEANRERSLVLIGSVNNAIHSTSDDSLENMNETLAGLVRQNDNVAFIAVTQSDGEVVAHSNSSYTGQTLTELAHLPNENVERDLAGYGEVYITARQVDIPDKGRFQIVAGIPTETIDGKIRETLISALITTLVILSIAILASAFFINQRVIIPIQKMEDGVKIFSQGDLTYQIVPEGSEELQNFARMLNSMARRIHQTQSRSLAILNAIPDLMFNLTHDGQYVDAKVPPDWYPPVRREDLVGKHMYDAIPKESAGLAQSFIDKTLETGEMQMYEYFIPESVGMRYYEARLVPSGENEILMIVRHVTEQKEAELKLKDSEEKFRTLFESTQVAAMLLDETAIQEANPAALETFGCENLEQLIGKHPADFSPETQPDGENSRQQAAEKIREALQTGTSSFEWQHARLDGIAFPADVLLTAMEVKGEKVLQALIRDITERKQAEEERERLLTQTRQALARAREAARVKGEFLATVSHELRTPLNAILGFCDMMLMGMTGELNERQAHQTNRIKENGKRLLSLINNILDLTRIESERTEIINKPFNPRDLVERVYAQNQVLAEAKNLAFILEIDEHLPEQLIGDSQRLEQVLVNLLSNALKFTDNGHVSLIVRADLDDGIWELAVQDTGVGIPPHAFDLIFDEFRQVDGSSTRAYKGSGLGLAITRNLVRLMNGKINLESELENGSTFTVILPLLETETEAIEAGM